MGLLCFVNDALLAICCSFIPLLIQVKNSVMTNRKTKKEKLFSRLKNQLYGKRAGDRASLTWYVFGKLLRNKRTGMTNKDLVRGQSRNAGGKAN